EANLVGMTMEDIDEYGLDNVTEQLKGKGPETSGGPTKDFKRALDMKDYDWFAHDRWQKQLQLMVDKGVRIEQQALASQSLEFVANDYLPEKIEKGDFLP
ncbi:MAG: DNA topoisomerase VI, partial [Candidatus Nanohaloarchaea archaeon]|nr:DNA topoisomerase VI [Candidatus Nanohaloarchaea archaeon]